MKSMENSIASIYPSINSSIVSNKLGIVKDIFYWLPEKDDARVFLVAAIAQNFSRMGIEMSTSFNSGAGLTFSAALNAAIGETVERYCSAIINNKDLVFGCYDALTKSNICVSPSEFAFYHDSQYEKDNFPFEKFDNRTEVFWTKCYQLGADDEVLIPAAVTYLPYYPKKEEKLIWYPVSTGVSCSVSIEEAIVKGIFEVIERDAFSILWYNNLSLPKINIHSNDDIYNLYKEKFEIPGCNYTLIDMTLDTRVPTVLGILEDLHGGVLIAAATRSSLKEAVIKTFIELSQGRISWKEDFIRGSTRDFREDFSDIRDFHSRVMLFTQKKMKKYFDFLLNSNNYVDIPDVPEESYEVQLNKLYNIFDKLGYKIYYKNLTTVDVSEQGYNVVRVIIPGFIEITNDHVYPRIGGERIYNIPYKMGLKDRITTIEDLNSIPHPFP